jgi:hypothetical protein
LKELSKALLTVFESPRPPYPLPSHVLATIQSYLDRHPNIADADSQRLHDELLNLYHRVVTNDEIKHAIFLSSLRLLSPAIRGADRLLEWWNILLRPTLESLSSHKGVVVDARGMLLNVLVFDDDDDADGEKARASSILTAKLLEVYLERTTISPPHGDCASVNDQTSALIAEHLESVLVGFGRKRPLVRRHPGDGKNSIVGAG